MPGARPRQQAIFSSSGSRVCRSECSPATRPQRLRSARARRVAAMRQPAPCADRSGAHGHARRRRPRAMRAPPSVPTTPRAGTIAGSGNVGGPPVHSAPITKPKRAPSIANPSPRPSDVRRRMLNSRSGSASAPSGAPTMHAHINVPQCALAGIVPSVSSTQPVRKAHTSVAPVTAPSSTRMTIAIVARPTCIRIKIPPCQRRRLTLKLSGIRFPSGSSR